MRLPARDAPVDETRGYLLAAPAVKARRAWTGVVLVAAAVLMVARAPVYVTAPSFWAEEGTLLFAFAWNHTFAAALAYRPAGYLLLYATTATAIAAQLVRAGLVALEHAPRVTVLCALAMQLVPVALIAWSRAPFWDGILRRTAGVAIVLFGALTDEVWLNTINCQPWLTIATALLLLEPQAPGWTCALVALAGLSAPVACTLLPLFAWRAFRVRTRVAVAHAVVLATAAVVQIACVASAWDPSMERRTAGLDLGVFAVTIWARAIVVPTLGVDVATRALETVRGSVWVEPLGGLVLLMTAAALMGWIARGLRGDARLLVGAFVLTTTCTLLTSAGGKTMLMNSPWASSRYFYAPGVLFLLAILGMIRRDAGRARVIVGGLVLAFGLAHGIAVYPTVRWQPGWPRWGDEVAAWRADPARELRIWPPPWKVGLQP